MTERLSKFVALCADDYGLSEHVDRGILSLLERNRLTTVSCMTTSPRWLIESADGISPHRGNAEIGLHLNWTEAFVNHPALSLGEVLWKSHCRALDRSEIEQRIHTQLDAFEKGMGCAPDFIDGHQHIHQLPQIRDALIQIIAQRYPQQPIWVRYTGTQATQLNNLKHASLLILGGYHLKKQLDHHRICRNMAFSGVYGFDTDDYHLLMEHWLGQASHGTLIMCHPSLRADAHDVIGKQRVIEYNYLSSDLFTDTLRRQRVSLVGIKEQLAKPLPVFA